MSPSASSAEFSQHGAAIIPVIVPGVNPGDSSEGVTPPQPTSRIANAEIRITGKMILVLSFI